KLLGPAVGLYFYLYVLLDLFSRFVVGWLVAEREVAALAEQLIAESCLRQLIARDQLTLHSDRGAPMTAKSLSVLLTDLGVTPSLARPRLPDDKDYAAYCTSFERSETTSGKRRRSASFRPRCLVGASAVGGS
ncbi:MAG TPA: transposase family protein, partial [Anaerolineales bacterium]